MLELINLDRYFVKSSILKQFIIIWFRINNIKLNDYCFDFMQRVLVMTSSFRDCGGTAHFK